MMRMQRELVFVPNVAKWSATGPLVTGLSVISFSVTGLNDRELVHEVWETVDEPVVENREAADRADWAAGFFRDADELEVVVALAL